MEIAINSLIPESEIARVGLTVTHASGAARVGEINNETFCPQ